MAQSANATAGGQLPLRIATHLLVEQNFYDFEQPGELARAAARLGEAGINTVYGYCGVAPGTNATFLIFGVAEAGEAVNIFDQAAAANAAI